MNRHPPNNSNLSFTFDLVFLCLIHLHISNTWTSVNAKNKNVKFYLDLFIFMGFFRKKKCNEQVICQNRHRAHWIFDESTWQHNRLLLKSDLVTTNRFDTLSQSLSLSIFIVNTMYRIEQLIMNIAKLKSISFFLTYCKCVKVIDFESIDMKMWRKSHRSCTFFDSGICWFGKTYIFH